MVVRIAKQYELHGLDFCIITFYDPQRAAITKALEVEKLPTGCVYNVDSFQGMNHPTLIDDTLISTIADRERSRLCDLVFSSDNTSRILEFAASHECCSHSLSQRDGSRHQQVLSARGRKEYAPGAALPRLVTAPQRLDRLAGYAKQFYRASRTTRTAIQHPLSSSSCASIRISTCTPIPTATTSP
jgi:superfamily II RNA helicase